MFINCPNCGALVATNLATDLPPERCPSCGFGLRAEPDSPAAEAAPAPPTPAAPTFVAPPLAAATPVPTTGRAAPAVFVPLRPSRPASEPDGDVEPGQPHPPPDSAAEQPSTPPGDGVVGAATPVDPAPTALQPPPISADPLTDAQPLPNPSGSATAPEVPEARQHPEEPGALKAPDEVPDSSASASASVSASVATATATAPAARSAPRFALSRPDSKAASSWRLIAAAGGLALLLVVQLLLSERARLAGHAAWRPLVTALCTVVRCQVPAWREPAAITVQQRDVRPVEGRPGMLQVSATIRNEARRAQAWPRITLTLSDIDGRALGMRTFEPAEYLLQPPANITLASGEAVAIGLEIVEPSPHAVAFNFRFH